MSLYLNHSVGFQIGVGQQSRGHGLEPGLGDGQVHAVDGHVVARGALPSGLAPAVHGDGAGNVAHGNRVRVLLHLDLLELDKFGPSGLEVESPAGLVDPAVLGGTHQQGHESRGPDGLVGLRAALVASVGGDLHHGLDLGGPDHDAADGHQLADAFGLDVANGGGLGVGGGLEVDFVPEEIRGLDDQNR